MDRLICQLPFGRKALSAMTISRVRSRSSLRRQLPLTVAILVASAVALSLLGSFVLLRNAFTDRARHQLAQQMVSAATYFRTKQVDLQGAAQLVQDDSALTAALVSGDRDALILQLKSYYADLTVDLLDVTDARGRVLVRMEDPLISGDSLATLPSVRAALLGQQNCGVEQDPAQGNALTLRATLPLNDSSGRLVGTVSVGRNLNGALADEIGSAVQATIHFRMNAASPSAPPANVAPCAFTPPGLSMASSWIANRQEDGQAVLSGMVPILTGTDGRPVGAIEVVQPLSDVYDTITSVTVILLLVGLAAAAISAGVGIGLSRGLAGRLSALEAAAAAVAGGDLEQQMPVQGKDEIASLARSLGRMVQSLRERMAQSHELAVLAERTRLARELHDSITQSLFSLNLAARAALNPRTRNDPARLERALAMVGELAQSSLSEMRALLFELRPAQLQGEGLLAALRNFALAVEQRTGLQVRTELPEACDLSEGYQDVLYRVTQEALTNVVRHAHARQAVVRFHVVPGWAELTVEDDGIGIAAPETLFSGKDSAATGHYGIRGMRERVAALGGRLELRGGEAGRATGTRVIARLPLPSDDADRH